MSHQEVLQFNLELAHLKLVVDNFLSKREFVKVIEAGCGSLSHINLKDNYYLVGIDISEKQLDRNSKLKDKILGDIQNYNFSNDSFDMIACFWVLEHVEQPELALKNFAKAIKKGGIIIIAVPNVMSLKGLITKYTPHWFHVWFYRYIFNVRFAGIDDNAPFRTFLRFSISPESIKKIANENNLSVEFFTIYEDFRQEILRKKLHLENGIWKTLQWLFKKLTFGKFELGLTEYFILLKKKQI